MTTQTIVSHKDKIHNIMKLLHETYMISLHETYKQFIVCLYSKEQISEIILQLVNKLFQSWHIK